MKLPPMPPSLARTRGARGVRGFSMVEVLIAIVVLSFGLLGMVGLQAFSIQANRDARLQSVAVDLARELAEMMRGNKQVGVQTSAASNPYLVSLTSPLTLSSPSYCLKVSNAATGCGDTSVTANAVTLAQSQMTEWLARVDSQLPGARVVICFDSAPYDTTTGLPVWACTGTSSNIGTIVVKMGWTRGSTDRSSASVDKATDTGSRPLLVVPVTAGNYT